MMGELARDEGYGYSDLGIPMGAVLTAPPVPEQAPPDLRNFAMGALAQQERYQPFQGDIATGTTPWKRMDIEAARADEPRDITGGDPATTKWLGEQVADFVVPSEPWEYGMMAAGPAGRVAGKLGKIGALAAGVYGSAVDDAEAAPLKKLLSATGIQDPAHTKFSPWTHHRLADRRFDRPMHEIPVEYSGELPGTNVLPSLEALKGKVITPLVGDPTMAGKTIHSIDGVPLEVPLDTKGGHGYIRQTEGYANDGALATGIANRVKGLQKEFDTDQIIGTHTKMGAQSADFSHHIWGALARMLPNSPIPKAGVKELDNAIEAKIAAIPRTPAMIKNNEQYDWPKWAGVKDDNLEQRLALQPDAYRKAFINALSQKHGVIEGTPSVGAVRYATTDPELLFAPGGASGLSMTRLTGEIRPGDHPDFPRHLVGEGNFGLGGLLRQENMFPDIIERFDKAQPPDRWGRKMYMPPPGSTHGQLIDDRWLNENGQYLRDIGKMGELAAFDKYRQRRFGWND